MDNRALSEAVGSLLKRDGLADRAVRLQPCATGGNNRVYFVESAALPLVAKRYFRSSADKRDRLHAEWAFVNYAYAAGLRCVPKPIAVDTASQLALYERVDGRKLKADEIAEEDVLAAAEFVRLLNEPGRRRHAGGLPEASEAGFSLAEHFALVDRRLGRLAAATTSDERDAEADEFIAELSDYWQGMKETVTVLAARAQIPVGDVLPADLRAISPSDFGFHNALKRPDGSMCFIDFEYAGWDDPAKMAADFFLQPQVPVARKYFDMFLQRATDGFQSAPRRRRFDILRPVFAIKWCIIMMNPFVAERAQAGSFADPARDETERKRTQLAKAKTALSATKMGEHEWRMSISCR
jgi:hypothetical protein